MAPKRAIGVALLLPSCFAFLLHFFFLLPRSPSEGVADKIFFNGVIYTGDQSLPWADSFAIKSGRILDIGSLAQVQILAGSQTERENLQGRFIIPGFVDSHVHLIHAGMQMAKLNLHNVAKKEDFIWKVQNYVQGSEEDKWILGGGWNNDLWGGELPNKSWIDSYTINNPVWFVRMDGHMGLANSAALMKAGITRNTPDPPGGQIVKDELGDPTGVILETAMLLMASCVPKPTIGERRDALIRASKYALSKGVTAVTDFGRFIPGDPTTQVWDDFNEVYKWADASGSSLIRVCVFFPLESCRRLANIVRERGRHLSQWLQIGGLKAFADGSLGSRTALFHKPYEDDPQNFGVKIANSEWLLASLLEADSLDLQVAVHAIGDAANDMVLSANEEVASVSISSDRRFRIEHAQHLSSEAPSRFRSSQTIASIQPQHILVDALAAARKLGEERSVNGSFLFKSLLDNGVKLALGSDWPVVSLNPLDAIKAAVDRCPDGWNTSWIPSERIGIEYALRGYTLDAAYAAYMDQDIGSLAKGKLADFIVLSDNIFHRLNDVFILNTYVGGLKSYSAES